MTQAMTLSNTVLTVTRPNSSRTLRRLLAWVVPIALSGCVVEDAPIGAEMNDAEGGRGKADHALFGSCNDSCDTQAADGTCWCDEACEDFGDCCEDYGQLCIAECDSDEDCAELACPMGGGLHETCEAGQCVLDATILDCPGVECDSDEACKELACPFGGGLHEVCEEFTCQLEATILDCPGVECDSDEACKELACPFGGGLHETCEEFTCQLDATVLDCPGVECDSDEACKELVCPGGGGFAHEVCDGFVCVLPDGACG